MWSWTQTCILTLLLAKSTRVPYPNTIILSTSTRSSSNISIGGFTLSACVDKPFALHLYRLDVSCINSSIKLVDSHPISPTCALLVAFDRLGAPYQAGQNMRGIICVPLSSFLQSVSTHSVLSIGMATHIPAKGYPLPI